jgi:integrase
MAREIARGENGISTSDSDPPLTVDEALKLYADDLGSRGKATYNATQAKVHLPMSIRSKPVGVITVAELKSYRDALAKGMKPASVNRTITPLRAALRLGASLDQRISNHAAWNVGLKKLPAGKGDGSRNRCVILDHGVMRQIIELAYARSLEFGLLIDLAAQTGARYSQLAGMKVIDLQIERSRVMVPTSSKGRGDKKLGSNAVPITPALAGKLAAAARGHAPGAQLLAKPAGSDKAAWGPKHAGDGFAAIAKQLDLRDENGKLFTMYSLRHSSIVRQLLANVPPSLIAKRHDTSIGMLELTYGFFIDEHAGQQHREGLAGFDESSSILPLRAA